MHRKPAHRLNIRRDRTGSGAGIQVSAGNMTAPGSGLVIAQPGLIPDTDHRHLASQGPPDRGVANEPGHPDVLRPFRSPDRSGQPGSADTLRPVHCLHAVAVNWRSRPVTNLWAIEICSSVSRFLLPVVSIGTQLTGVPVQTLGSQACATFLKADQEDDNSSGLAALAHRQICRTPPATRRSESP